MTQLQASQGCSAKTTENACDNSNAVYHGENVQGCLDQYQSASCADIMSSQDESTYAPKCEEICIVPT